MCVPQGAQQANMSPNANGAVFTSLKQRLFGAPGGGQGAFVSASGPSPSYRSGGSVIGSGSSIGGSSLVTTGG